MNRRKWNGQAPEWYIFSPKHAWNWYVDSEGFCFRWHLIHIFHWPPCLWRRRHLPGLRRLYWLTWPTRLLRRLREVLSPLQGPAASYGSSFSRAIEMDLGADIPMTYRRRLVSELCGLFPRVELRTRKIDAGYTYTTWVELEKDVDAPPFETDTWIRLAFSS